MLGLPETERGERHEVGQWRIDDSLLQILPGRLVAGLASLKAITSANKVTISVRSYLRFSVRAPFDASAVQTGIPRKEDAPDHGRFRSQLHDASRIAVWRSNRHLLFRPLEHDAQNRRGVRLDGVAQIPV
jgi:hypothetical protein